MKRMILALICLLCIFSSFKKLKDVVLTANESGLFSCFLDVVTLVKGYEYGVFDSVCVDYEKKGLYYDKSHGPNWWTYYFDPIDLGIRSVPLSKCTRVQGNSVYIDSMLEERTMSAKEARTLISKYIHIKDELQQEIDDYAQAHFNCFVIGVHYRGTDKWCEAPRVNYEEMFFQINNQIKLLGNKEYKIFVATDEQAFLEDMLSVYGDKVLYLELAPRSSDKTATHYMKKSPYENGKYAIMDCLLLSKTNILIRTSSNLSLASIYYNPDLKVIELNRRR